MPNDFLNFMNYNNIFTFENLYKAHLKARLGKRHKKEVINFELDLGNNLWKIKKKIDTKTYFITGYNTFIITDPKKRLIQALRYEDRIVQHALVDNYLMPLLERYLIYDNGACRINKGTDFCIKRVRNFLTKFYHKYNVNGYILKFDIHHYFESIKHDVLKEKLNKIVKDGDIMTLINIIIDSYKDYDNSGLPIGNQTSQCFALYYLDCVDRLIKEKYRFKYYSRYMDDGVIISNNKSELKKVLNDIIVLLNKIGLSINENKTRIYKIKDGFTYLGFRFMLLETGKIVMKIPKKKKRRIIRYIKSSVRINKVIDYYKNYLKNGNNYNFYIKIKNIKI